MDGDEPGLPAGLPDAGQDREGPGGPSHHDLVDLSQAVVPAELAHRDDEVLPGHHDDLLDQGTGLQGQQGADQHRLVSQG